MYSSYTETPEHWTPYSDGKTTADHENRHRRQNSRKYINHSGNVGDAIPGSANQQNPSDHDKLATSDPNCHNFQTISKSCTASFQIMPEVKKRYIIRTYTQGSAPAVPEISRNVLTITGNGLTETVFRFWRQFKYFVGEDLRTIILRKLTAYMCPVPIVPSFTRIFIYGIHRKLFQRIQHISNASNALNTLEQVLPTHLTH